MYYQSVTKKSGSPPGFAKGPRCGYGTRRLPALRVATAENGDLRRGFWF
jgi:hypothetical protein